MPRRLLLSMSLLIPVLAVVLIAVATRATDPGGASGERWEEVPVPQGQLQPGQPFQFRRFAYRRTSHALEEVQLRIVNTSESPQRGVVWYLLSPPGADEAWREAIWSSPEQEISLLPGESADLTFAPPQDAPVGAYALSAWVHGLRAGERFHADGAGSPAAIYLGPPIDLTISSVTRAEQIDGSIAFDVTLIAANHSGASLPAKLLFGVFESPAERADVPDGEPLYLSPAYATSLDDGETAAATLHGTIRLPPGSYTIVGLLQRQDDQSVVKRVVAYDIIAIE